VFLLFVELAGVFSQLLRQRPLRDRRRRDVGERSEDGEHTGYVVKLFNGVFEYYC